MIWALLLDLSGTIITMQPTAQPGAIAEIVMDNRRMNGSHDEIGTFLEMPGLSIGVHFDWNVEGDDDALIVSPPDGIICVPSSCVLQVPENEVGILYLYAWEGM